jgi:N-acetylmuramoyl-L-alanine amidase
MKLIRSITIAGMLLLGGTTANAATITIKEGDTLWDLGNQYSIPYQEIMIANNLNNDLIITGQELTIPEGRSEAVTVQQTAIADHSQSEIDILASLVQAEAKGESFEGKIAVAAVVLNRVDDSRFPNSIREVIYQRGQFSPVSNGSINKRADSESYDAVNQAIRGYDPTQGAVFFYNPRIAQVNWNATRPVTTIIGNHTFSN